MLGTDHRFRAFPGSNAQVKPKNTFRNLVKPFLFQLSFNLSDHIQAWGFTGAMFVAVFALYSSKKYVEGRRKADLEIYEKSKWFRLFSVGFI